MAVSICFLLGLASCACVSVVSAQTTAPTTAAAATTTAETYTDCWELRNPGGISESGVYEIHPVGGPAASVDVWCDMETDGGGWTLLQRRFDGSIPFFKTMSEYKNGFGRISDEYWLGLEWMHAMTSLQDKPVQLRIDLCSFTNRSGYAVYDHFSVDSRDDEFRLNTGTYKNGSILDNLTRHNGSPFNTTGKCAFAYRGGWWYDNCISANLNGGRYNAGRHAQGIAWAGFGSATSYTPSLRSSEMKIRPFDVTGDTSSPYRCPP